MNILNQLADHARAYAMEQYGRKLEIRNLTGFAEKVRNKW